MADYASIEARVLLWCAQDEDALQLFRDGRCIYMDFASYILKKPVTDKEKQAKDRMFGKVGILGLGYQCGVSKFVTVAQTLGGITIQEDSDDPNEITSRKIVEAYREKYWRVKQLWYDQETAAGEATFGEEGIEHECYPVTWIKEGRFLYCRLPSGRKLSYPDPAIKVITTSWGARKNALTYMGVNALSRKWMRQASYGGLLVENLVQAISRDILAEAMTRCEESRIYSPILTIHDEIVCEANQHHGNVEEFGALVGQCPSWSPGLPVATESWAGNRYRK